MILAGEQGRPGWGSLSAMIAARAAGVVGLIVAQKVTWLWALL
jgi:hypothetical protein